MTKEHLLYSIQKLDKWIELNGWAGFDPYDIKSQDWILKVTKWGAYNKALEIVREIIFEILYAYPQVSRKIFNVKPQINPKGMALFSKAYLDLYQYTGSQKFLDTSSECLKWLIENRSETTAGVGWGYPFHWQSARLIPQGTANGIVTTAVGDAVWSWYKHTSDPKYLDICIQICKFFETLPRHNATDDQICFAYTPLYQNHIHNLNLFIAEFIVKIGKETNNQQWIELGVHAANYTLSNQLPDGSFDYNGPPEKPKNYIDNYHTGFVLRMLHSLWFLTNDKNIYTSLKKCYDHYVDHLFEDKTIPKLLPDRKYRIDIHSCAESINCLSELSSSFPEGLEISKNVAEWTIETLQDDKGYFYYGILKSRFTGRTYVSKIPYMRWGQAWMLKSLSNLLINL
jgi:rhamnogalacturonyl hydrolase YesR